MTSYEQKIFELCKREAEISIFDAGLGNFIPTNQPDSFWACVWLGLDEGLSPKDSLIRGMKEVIQPIISRFPGGDALVDQYIEILP